MSSSDLPVVFFSAVEEGDLLQLRIWRDQLMEAGVVRETRYLNMIDQCRWLERVTGPDSRDRMMAVRLQLEGNRLVGVVGLTGIDWVQRHAEVSIYVGDEDVRKAGVGEAALRKLCAYAFDQLGLHRLTAEIFGDNHASLTLFQKAGFIAEGLLREHRFWAGKWHDSVVFGLLAEEKR